MAKGNAKELRKRIKSVGNIRKITKAMEMVAAAKMKKVIAKAISARTYAEAAWGILVNISESVLRSENPLLTVRPVKRICVVLFSSNKGLCGGLNNQLIKKILEQVKEPYSLMVNRVRDKKIEPEVDPKKLEIDFVTIGRKGTEAAIRAKQNVVASFVDWNEQLGLDNVYPLSGFLLENYEKAYYDKIVVAYSNFVSVVRNQPKIRQILPLSRQDIEKQLEELGKETKIKVRREEVKEIREAAMGTNYIFEPTKEKVLKVILPRMIESQIYQSFLESQASEFSSRMLTMKNASDVAGEMMEDFNLYYNIARQAGITSELAEISAGITAMEG
ncbi:MAG: ATP synthase F1 subunit gamma [Candidatus Moraniibacteriota bacterium]